MNQRIEQAGLRFGFGILFQANRETVIDAEVTFDYRTIFHHYDYVVGGQRHTHDVFCLLDGLSSKCRRYGAGGASGGAHDGDGEFRG